MYINLCKLQTNQLALSTSLPLLYKLEHLLQNKPAGPLLEVLLYKLEHLLQINQWVIHEKFYCCTNLSISYIITSLDTCLRRNLLLAEACSRFPSLSSLCAQQVTMRTIQEGREALRRAGRGQSSMSEMVVRVVSSALNTKWGIS